MKDAPRPLRVCYFGTYRAEYSRNQILLEGLRRSGVEVVMGKCLITMWSWSAIPASSMFSWLAC